jgi:hypothetical protein
MVTIRLLKGLFSKAAQPVFVPSVPTQGDYAGMVRRRQREFHAITDRLIAGKISPGEWFDLMESVILEGHTAAYEMGRNRAGDLTENVNDLLRGMAKRDQESYYLRGFAEALQNKDPRYWDEELRTFRETIKSRQNLYIGKMRGTANEAFVRATPDALDEFYWRLGGAEEHCDECPQYAALSPFTKATLFSVPGASDTPCRTNCLCHLERVDGQTGFKPVEI